MNEQQVFAAECQLISEIYKSALAYEQAKAQPCKSIDDRVALEELYQWHEMLRAKWCLTHPAE